MKNFVFSLVAALAMTAGVAQAGECCKEASVVVVASCNPCEVVCRPGLVKRVACHVQSAVDNAKARCEARKEARRKARACACVCNCVVVDPCASNKVDVKVDNAVVAPAPVK